MGRCAWGPFPSSLLQALIASFHRLGSHEPFPPVICPPFLLWAPELRPQGFLVLSELICSIPGGSMYILQPRSFLRRWATGNIQAFVGSLISALLHLRGPFLPLGSFQVTCLTRRCSQPNPDHSFSGWLFVEASTLKVNLIIIKPNNPQHQ